MYVLRVTSAITTANIMGPNNQYERKVYMPSIDIIKTTYKHSQMNVIIHIQIYNTSDGNTLF